jgi:hypothetical protein
VGEEDLGFILGVEIDTAKGEGGVEDVLDARSDSGVDGSFSDLYVITIQTMHVSSAIER